MSAFPEHFHATAGMPRFPFSQAEDFLIAWREIAPDATFGGKTLAEFEAATVPFKDAVTQLKSLTIQRSAAQKTRDEEEESLKGLLVLIAHGVRSAPDHGEDSPLYRAMGFVSKSERASGLVRPSQAAEPPTNEETAA